MNPVFLFLVILGAIILWFLLSFVFFPLGRLCYRIWKDAIDEINKQDENIKAEKEKQNGKR